MADISLLDEKNKLEKKANRVDPYLPDEGLKESLKMALYLKNRPLLIMGDPGSGKTRFAEWAAVQIHGITDYKKSYFEWHIKSTSKARDGLYTYDALKRLHDAQIKDESKKVDISNMKNYINYGPLGNAILECEKNDNKDVLPPVVLIDEIDKAGIDFPNDLLHELDQMEFEIDEWMVDDNKKRHGAKNRMPLIIITSNRERDLPPAFLRRCLFYQIKFPDKPRLKEIIQSHFSEYSTALLDECLDEFIEIRKKMDAKETESEKKVSTSELIDWFRYVNFISDEGKKFNKLDEIRKKLSYDKEKDSKIPPFAQALLKNWNSISEMY